MADTQPLPSWMTLSTVVITGANGQPIATSTTTLELPLTYYGPSIPLGTNGAWTWGGLTPPASTTSLSSPTTSNTLTTTPSTFTSTTPSSTSAVTTSASATPYPYSNSSTLSKGAIIGIIFGAIAAFNVLLFLVICFVRQRARRLRNRHHQTPIWTHWEVVGASGRAPDERPTGMGSPRDSGEEADSFLRRSRGATNGAGHAGSSVRPVPSLPPGAAPPQIVGSTGSGDSRHTGSSGATDYGVLLPGGGPIGQAYRDESYFPTRSSSEMIGCIMSPDELMKIDDEEEPPSPPRMYGVPPHSVSSLPETFSPLLPPPPLDVDRMSIRKSSLNEKEKSIRSLSYPASDMEDPKVYTARRVKVKELGPRSASDEDASPRSPADDGPVAGPSSWRSSLGLGSLSRLRKSWFGSSTSRSGSKSSSGGRIRAEDTEVTQSLLGAPQARSRPGLGLTIDGERPMSSVSARSAVSGHTVYHDAVSRLGTPVSVPSRAVTPASARGPVITNDFIPPVPTGAPPAYAVSDPYDSFGSRGSFPYSQGVDVLDLPVPQPAPPFTASGGTSSTTRNIAGPPGLQGSHARTWRDSLSVITGSSNNASVTIDVLDAEPPTAGEGWRSMAGLLGASTGEEGSDTGERRATFGTPQIVHPLRPILSDQGSLHSMQSYLSPYSHSSGSAPISSQRSQALSGSNSSRPSAHSRIQTMSSGSVRSGSLSSFGRRRGSGAISPSVSAFGGTVESGRLSVLEELTSGKPEGYNRVSVLGPMPSFAHSVTAPTIQSIGATTQSDETEVTRTTATLTSSAEVTLLDKDDHGLTEFQLGTFDFEDPGR